MKQIELTKLAGIRGLPRNAGYIVEVGNPADGEDIISEVCAKGLIQSGKAKETTTKATASK